MNVIEARQSVLKFFEKEDCINVDDDFKKLVLISLEEERDKAAIYLALKGLETIGVIASSTVGEKIWWVLSRPLITLPQTIELSYNTARFITDIVNNYCEAKKDTMNLADVSNIKEKDIA